MPSTSRTPVSRSRRGGLALFVALALSTVAACSSAPAKDDGTLAGADPGASATSGAASAPGAAPATSGTTTKVLSDGTKVTTTTKNGQTVTTTTSKSGKTTTTVTKPGAPAGKPGTGGKAGSGGTAAGPQTNTNPGGSALFKPDEERIGLTDTSMQICAHAALTYGQAFGTKESDFNVFWDALNAEKGGIFGRKVKVNYKNDDYKPTTAVDAATQCKATPGGIFMLLGGIGFDQIPAVRNWAESNRMLYVHHTATINGTKGQKFSFSELPTVERTGEAFAQLALSKYKGSKIGIIERDSANWTPGVKAFRSYGESRGLKIVADKQVANNKGNYTDEILAMKGAGADVVWGWVNALEATQLLKQAKAQNYNPRWLLFPFNLTSQTLEDDALTPTLDGVAMYPAYSKGDYSGGFASYADDIKEFERQYKKYDPNIDLGGIGGDLLFLNWVAQKALAVQLTQCGQDCTRDKFIDVMRSYQGKSPSSSSCPIDFRNDPFHGSDALNFMSTYKSPSGKVNWRTTQLCVRR